MSAAILDETIGDDALACGEGAVSRELRMLDELAGYGCAIARVIAERVHAADPGQPVAELQAAALAYARVARAVRLTVMLKAKLIEAQADGQIDEADAVSDTDGAHNALEEDRKFRVERIVERVARARHGDDEDEVERLTAEASERLDDDDLYGGVLDRPMSELLALICRDLHLPLDWPRLAQEAWARQEIAGGKPGGPLAALAAASPGPTGGDARAGALPFQPPSGWAARPP